MSKYQEAIDVIKRCCYKGVGFFASTHLYSGQLWLRDLYYSLEGIAEAGLKSPVKSQLMMVLRFFERKGRVPSFVYVTSFVGHFRFGLHAVLARMFDRPVHSWTADNPSLLILSCIKYSELFGDGEFLKNVEGTLRKVADLIASIRDEETGLIIGADYRDSLIFDKPLLSANLDAWLAFKKLGMDSEAKDMRNAIERHMKRGAKYFDFPDSNTTDVLGLSKLIIYEYVSQTEAKRVCEQILSCSGRFGILNIRPMYACEIIRESWNECVRRHKVRGLLKKCFDFGVARNCKGDYQNGNIWPFVHSWAVIALAKAGYLERAERELRKFERLEGFYEYYDSESGEPRGSANQLWSAAAYVWAKKELEAIKGGHTHGQYATG